MKDGVGKRHGVATVVEGSSISISVDKSATCISEQKYIVFTGNEDGCDNGNEEEAQGEEEDEAGDKPSDDWNWEGYENDSNVKINLRLLCFFSSCLL